MFKTKLKTKFSGKTHYVHRLVSQKYIPNPENKSTVNHINGIKDDNRVENLEWATRSENNQHAHDNGLKGMAQLRQRKLTMKEAREIREKYIPWKYTMMRLSKEYGVNPGNISKIIRNIK